MNHDRVGGKWEQFIGFAREPLGKLTDDEKRVNKTGESILLDIVLALVLLWVIYDAF